MNYSAYIAKLFPQLLVVILLTYSVLTSCNKTEDEQFPVITFITPSENSIHNVLDTIHVEVNISDNVQILSVEICLVDENFVPVLKSFYPIVQKNPMVLVFDYPLDEYFLESGNYNILIKVGDGVQFKHKYQSIRVNAVPKSLNGLALAYSMSGNNIVSILDSNFSFEHILETQLIPFNNMAVFPFHNCLAYIFNDKDQLESWDYNQKQRIWTYDNSMNPSGRLYKVVSNSNSFFTFSDDGFIRSFNFQGKQKLVIHDVGYIPNELVVFQNYFLTISKSINSPIVNSIRVYHSATGSLMQQYSLDFEPTSLFPIDDNKFLVAGNTNFGGQIREYDLINNTIWKPIDLGGEFLNEIVRISNTNFIIKMDNDIKSFNLNTYSLNTLSQNSQIKNLVFEELNNYLIGSEGSTLSFYSLPNLTTIWTRTFPLNTEIQQIIPLYNR